MTNNYAISRNKTAHTSFSIERNTPIIHFYEKFRDFFFAEMSPNGRLTKELNEVGKVDPTSGVRAVAVIGSNSRELKGTINGPTGTCYEGGVFKIDISIPKQYPFEPPKMKFTTKIWHPNISSQTGAICLVRSMMYRDWLHRRQYVSYVEKVLF